MSRSYLRLRGRVQLRGHRVLQSRDDPHELDDSSPYTLLGPVYYETHRGARPMQIEWLLEYSSPAALYQEIKLAAG